MKGPKMFYFLKNFLGILEKWISFFLFTYWIIILLFIF
jgi:hypothetical protein